MCGIAGFITNKQLYSRSDLELMTNAMQHRGPDASGFYYNDTAGLGHRRLSIIDLSESANQPMVSCSGRYQIIFNGEIYNFQDIAKELDVPLKTHGDTEVLLEAYAKWGATFLDKLNGMFSLAIYDTQEHTLFVARDRIGIKPLYYYNSPDAFVFASELKAFQAFPPLKGELEIDKVAVSEFLYLGYIPAPRSIYKQVKKFPQGHYAIIDLNKGDLQLQQYYDLQSKVGKELIKDEQQAKAQLKELVTSSVSYRMISDVPFGTFLSGGIDSSLVTAVAQSVSATPVNTFSIGFEEATYNESKFAAEVAKYLGTAHHEFTVSHKEAIDLFEDILDVYDEPFADSSSVPTMLVSRMARQNVTMVLSGDGGDETYMGYGFYKWAERLKDPVFSLLRSPAALATGFGDSRMKRVSNLLKANEPGRFKSHVFSQEQYYFRIAEIKELMKDGWYQAPDIDEQLEVARKLQPAEEQALFDMLYYLPDDLLVKVDRASMKYSLEARVPLLDHRLMEFALNVDPALKRRDGTAKYLLKQLLYDYVPASYFDRPKWGFGMPIVKWLRNELKYLIDEYLSENRVNRYDMVRWPIVDDLVKSYLAGNDYLYNRIWALILLHKWYSKNIDRS